jgi:putative tryptophan/tyrosine transport system substrate-binding protein
MWISSNRNVLAAVFGLLTAPLWPTAAETDFAQVGGLLSLGPDFSPIGRGATDYIDRILAGAKVAELPVMNPLKFLLIVNLNAAETLGLMILPSVLLGADEVIE